MDIYANDKLATTVKFTIEAAKKQTKSRRDRPTNRSIRQGQKRQCPKDHQAARVGRRREVSRVRYRQRYRCRRDRDAELGQIDGQGRLRMVYQERTTPINRSANPCGSTLRRGSRSSVRSPLLDDESHSLDFRNGVDCLWHSLRRVCSNSTRAWAYGSHIARGSRLRPQGTPWGKIFSRNSDPEAEYPRGSLHANEVGRTF